MQALMDAGIDGSLMIMDGSYRRMDRGHRSIKGSVSVVAAVLGLAAAAAAAV